MYLVIENSDKTFSFPENKTLLVGNDFDCDVQINHPKIWGRHYSITHNSYGCVLEVFNDAVVVNDQAIFEKSLLDIGDVISIDEMNFRLLDDSFIPKDSSLDPDDNTLTDKSNASSVFGVRSFAAKSAGQFIIDHFHHPDGWHVYRYNHELHLIDDEGKTLLNGLPIERAQLQNGDVISEGGVKYKVELPGSSGFSKFSPSHPRNVQLSESFSETNSKTSETAVKNGHGFFLKNLWWMTLLVGLVLLVVAIINNPNQ